MYWKLNIVFLIVPHKNLSLFHIFSKTFIIFCSFHSSWWIKLMNVFFTSLLESPSSYLPCLVSYVNNDGDGYIVEIDNRDYAYMEMFAYIFLCLYANIYSRRIYMHTREMYVTQMGSLLLKEEFHWHLSVFLCT